MPSRVRIPPSPSLDIPQVLVRVNKSLSGKLAKASRSVGRLGTVVPGDHIGDYSRAAAKATGRLSDLQGFPGRPERKVAHGEAP